MSQDTREKIEVYEQLGYYFVTFRALDETYFRYSEVPASSSSQAASSESSLHKGASLNGNNSADQHSTPDEKAAFDIQEGKPLNLDKSSSRRSIDGEKSEHGIFDTAHRDGRLAAKKRGKVEIVEGPKEGVEGVGVGAVNVYMIVFGDGIISVGAVIRRATRNAKSCAVSLRGYRQAYQPRQRSHPSVRDCAKHILS